MKKKQSLIVYVFLTAFIASWWVLAFRSAKPKGDSFTLDFHQELLKQIDPHFFQIQLAKMDRKQLSLALNGDVSLMAKLIAEWDLDAELLESNNLLGIKRISKEAFIRSQLLGRLFESTSKEELASLQDAYRLKGVIDDNGKVISLNRPFQRFLPQTYVSASFLLALADPEQIVAIPKGIREQTTLYSPLLTKKIHYDIDRINTEYFYHAKPEIAFVSHYSHPSTLETLRNQGIELFSLNAIETLPDIQNALIRIGSVINRSLEAELLTIFMEAAMVAVDNRLLVLRSCYGVHYTKQKMLYLNYYTQFACPSSKTLTWQLLERLGVTMCLPTQLIDKHSRDFAIPLDQEQIVHINPECMIIATAEREATIKQIQEIPAFSSLSAVRQKRIFFVDETIQHSPSQFIVLAYYDLAQALSHEKLNQIQVSHIQVLSRK